MDRLLAPFIALAPIATTVTATDWGRDLTIAGICVGAAIAIWKAYQQLITRQAELMKANAESLRALMEEQASKYEALLRESFANSESDRKVLTQLVNVIQKSPCIATGKLRD